MEHFWRPARGVVIVPDPIHFFFPDLSFPFSLLASALLDDQLEPPTNSRDPNNLSPPQSNLFLGLTLQGVFDRVTTRCVVCFPFFVFTPTLSAPPVRSLLFFRGWI